MLNVFQGRDLRSRGRSLYAKSLPAGAKTMLLAKRRAARQKRALAKRQPL